MEKDRENRSQRIPIGFVPGRRCYLIFGRFHREKILLRDHPRSKTRVARDIMKLSWSCSSNKVMVVNQPLPPGNPSQLNTGPPTNHHQSQHHMIVVAFIAVPPLHQHTRRTA